MTPEQFCYWLRGFFELAGKQKNAHKFTPEMIEMIALHLNSVFTQKTIEPTTILNGAALLNERLERLKQQQINTSEIMKPPIVTC